MLNDQSFRAAANKQRDAKASMPDSSQNKTGSAGDAALAARLVARDHALAVRLLAELRQSRLLNQVAEAANGPGGLDTYQHAIKEFRARNWTAASATFQSVLDVRPRDGPAQVYLNRFRCYKEAPPPNNWDGVWQMSEK